MNSDKFFEVGKKVVKELAESTLCPTDGIKISLDDVYMVLYAYVLGNMKATFSTNLSDGKYYEVTYNSATDELYVDQYVKLQQKIHHPKTEMASEYGESCKSPYQQFIDSIDEEPVAPMRKIEEGFGLDLPRKLKTRNKDLKVFKKL